MSDFVCLFRTTEAARNENMGTPERAQQSMKAWGAWLGKLEAGGNLKERGQPMEATGKVVRGKKKVVTDGPYVEVKDLVAGFMILAARDLGQAIELASGCPILEGEGSVEVRPVMEMNWKP
jgi:hypothetical protein